MVENCRRKEWRERIEGIEGREKRHDVCPKKELPPEKSTSLHNKYSSKSLGMKRVGKAESERQVLLPYLSVYGLICVVCVMMNFA